MASPLTVRLNPSVRQRIAQVAKQKKCTPSAVVREAVDELLAREEKSISVYDQIKDLIGVGETGGDPRLSENTGRKFTELLLARQAKRDSG
jgi:hypothetical protein